ncbi:hypothetical protein LXJ59_27740, partial [Escherichia coli]|nr:hypothetical protein [Escherichia coli]
MRLAFATALALTVSTPALAAGSLPKTVVPVLYDIAVSPDAEKMTFSGTETVAIDVKAPTRTIVLNAADLAIANATFDGKAVPFALDKAKPELTLTLPAAATAGRHSVAFAWTGKINQSAAGF